MLAYDATTESIMSERKSPPSPALTPPYNDSASDENSVSGENSTPATTSYVKRKISQVITTQQMIGAKQQAMSADVHQSVVDAVVAKGRSMGALIMSAIGVTAAVLLSLDTRAQNKVDVGVAPIIVDVTELKKEVKEIKRAQQQAALNGARDSVMIEMLLTKFRMEPPLPAPKVQGPDAGP